MDAVQNSFLLWSRRGGGGGWRSLVAAAGFVQHLFYKCVMRVEIKNIAGWTMEVLLNSFGWQPPEQKWSFDNQHVI